ncbi:MAG: hypothetical protein HY321_07775 [Armatimonadetes bacterium]|nr:hypothetical protein [Armatimonadota bacterium]
MQPDSCEGCVRARSEDGYAVPGALACLGCRRALPDAPGIPDRWTACPPGGTPASCDDAVVSFLSPLPLAAAHAVAAGSALLGAAWLAAGLPAWPVIPLLMGGAWLALGPLRPRIRHYWAFQGARVRHVARIGAIAVSRAYAVEAIRAFHCTGPRAAGPVGFHHGRYTVQVASLGVPADNQWLMRRLNERLAAARVRHHAAEARV